MKSDSLITQKEGTAVNGLYLNSASDGSGSNNKTSEMSGYNYAQFSTERTDRAKTEGRFSNVSSGTKTGFVATGSSSTTAALKVDMSHTHNIYACTTDTETRPENYTVRIWKRVS